MPRQTDWIDTVTSLAPASDNQANVSLISGLAPSNMRGTTLIRTIIRLGISSATVAGAWGVQTLDMGIGITSQEAFAAGALPDPNVAGDRPPRGWVWRDRVVVAQNGDAGPIVSHVRADIRASRKVENGELFFIVWNTAGEGTSFTVNVRILIRALILLP